MKAYILIPGVACQTWIWDSLIKQLSPKYKYTKVDWPTNLTQYYHSVNDFVLWISSHYKMDEFEGIIAFGMGGLVATVINSQQIYKFKNIIAIESFLTFPPQEFHERIYDKEDKNLNKKISLMLDNNQLFYSMELLDNLQTPNFKDFLRTGSIPIDFIYGSRNLDTSKFKEKLGMTLDNVKSLSFVSNSSHFPMLENRDQTAQIINSIIS